MRPLLAILGVAGFAVAAQAASTHSFHFSKTVLSQCTGESTAVELDGTVTLDRRVAGGMVTYSAESRLTGSATGALSGTRVELAGDERIELEDPGAGQTLVVLDHLYSADAGPASAPLGFATATLAIDGKGRVTGVTTDFEFTCD